MGSDTHELNPRASVLEANSVSAPVHDDCVPITSAAHKQLLRIEMAANLRNCG